MAIEHEWDITTHNRDTMIMLLWGDDNKYNIVPHAERTHSCTQPCQWPEFKERSPPPHTIIITALGPLHAPHVQFARVVYTRELGQVTGTRSQVTVHLIM